MTNSVESIWTILKKGFHGAYHHLFKNYIDRYVDEFVFRLNEGIVDKHTVKRIGLLYNKAMGKLLISKGLVSIKEEDKKALNKITDKKTVPSPRHCSVADF